MTDYKNLTVEEVLEAVRNGEISAEEVLEIEKQGKARRTLVEALEEIISGKSTDDEFQEPPQDQTLEDPEETLITVEFNKNVKLGTDLFKTGDKIDVNEGLYETLVNAKVIEES